MRRGLTLVELIVAIVLSVIVMGAATSSLLRQQRTHLTIRSVSDADRQLAASMLVIAAQLSTLDRAAQDVTPGEARDTALQFRASLGASISCPSSRGSTILAADLDSVALGGFATPPAAGDSLWWYGDSTWNGAEVTAVASVATSCAASGSAQSLKLTLRANDTIPGNAPLRVTRPTRYALYKSGDGTWQLGVREWNPTTSNFAPPQPAVGPLLLASGTRQSGFRYFDENGSELPASSTPADVRRVSRIRFVAHSRLSTQERGQDSVRSDSIEVALLNVSKP